jgi:hypothetical protein
MRARKYIFGAFFFPSSSTLNLRPARVCVCTMGNGEPRGKGQLLSVIIIIVLLC